MELVRWEPFAGFGNFHSVLNDLFDGHADRSPARPSYRSGIRRWMYWRARMHIWSAPSFPA